MTKLQIIVQWVIVINVALLVGHDLSALILGHGIGATMSHALILKSQAYPEIPLAFGLLVGHLFL